MSSGELAQIHERMAALQRKIEERKRPPPRLLWLGQLLLGAWVGGGLALVAAPHWKPAPPAPLMRSVPAVMMQDRAPMDERTATMVPLYWTSVATDPRTDDAAMIFTTPSGVDSLYVAVIASEGHQPRWVRGPFEGPVDRLRTHLRRIDRGPGEPPELLLVTADGHLHALDFATGRETAHWSTNAPVLAVCTGKRRYAWTLSTSTANEGFTLDASKGELSAGHIPTCTHEEETPCPLEKELNDTDFPCSTGHHVLGSTLDRALVSFLDEDAIFTVGYPKARRTAPFFGVFYDQSEKKITWQGQLSLPDDGGRERDFRYVVAAHRLVLATKTESGQLRLVSRDIGGMATWNRLLPGTTEANSLQAIAGTPTKLYVTLDDRVAVLSASTGEDRASITSVSIAGALAPNDLREVKR